jgi:hypothetical protein
LLKKYKKLNVWREAVCPSFIKDARLLKVKFSTVTGKSRNSSTDTEIRLQTGQPKNNGSIPLEDKKLSSSPKSPTGYRAHPAYYSIGIWNSVLKG